MRTKSMFAITGQGTHQNLLSHFNNITEDLDHIHLYQTSIDGPNVNIKFYQEFSVHAKESTSFIEVLPLEQKILGGNYKRV